MVKVRLRLLQSAKRVFANESTRLVLWLLCFLGVMFITPIFGFGLYGHNNLQNQNAIIEIFSVVVGALASILGIVIAFMIATIEMNRRYFASYAENLFKNETLRSLVVLYTGTIIVAVVGLLSLNFDNKLLTTNLVIATVYLFFICITILIPRVRKLMSDTSTSQEVGRLTREMVKGSESGRLRLDSNVLYELAEISKKASSGGDERLLTQLIDALNDTFDEIASFIEEGNNDVVSYRSQPREVAGVFSYAFSVIAAAAIRNNQLNLAAYSCDSIFRIMRFFSEKKRLYADLIETEEDLKKIIQLSIESGHEDLSPRLIYKYEQLVVKRFKENTPPAEELWEFEAFDKSRDPDDIKHNLSNHWQHITHHYLSDLRSYAKNAIKYSDERSLSAILSVLQNLAISILDIEELTFEHKLRAARLVNGFLEGISREIILSDMMSSDGGVSLYYLHPTMDIDKQVKADLTYATWNLQTVSNILLFAAKNGKLSVGTINNIAVSGRVVKHLIKESDFAARTVIYVVSMLGEIKNVVAEKALDDPWAASVYVECYEQALSIQQWNKEIRVNKVTRRLNSLIREYVHIDEAKKVKMGDKEADIWGSLFED